MKNWEAPDPCAICGFPVSMRKSAWSRLARPDGGFDHTQCALGMDVYEFRRLHQGDRPRGTPFEEPRHAPKKWVFWKNLGDGSWKITCNLCGKTFTRVFRPDKHEDPKRAASDYVGQHLASAPHEAAMDAYKRPPPPESREERLLREAFGEADNRSTESKRLSAAREAAYLRARKP